ncbi:hypothetical protein Tco_1149414, partial [Tanacetum coccineum]
FQHIYVLTDMELCVSSDVVINLWHDSTDADKAEETEKEDKVVFSGGKMQSFEVIVPCKATLLLHLLSTYEQKGINYMKLRGDKTRRKGGVAVSTEGIKHVLLSAYVGAAFVSLKEIPGRVLRFLALKVVAA